MSSSILRASWICMSNSMAIHSVVVGIFQCWPKWWTMDNGSSGHLCIRWQNVYFLKVIELSQNLQNWKQWDSKQPKRDMKWPQRDANQHIQDKRHKITTEEESCVVGVRGLFTCPLHMGPFSHDLSMQITFKQRAWIKKRIADLCFPLCRYKLMPVHLHTPPDESRCPCSCLVTCLAGRSEPSWPK